MKFKLSQIAMTLAFAYAAMPAGAATTAEITQSGVDGSNKGYVEQGGVTGASSATITQVGSGNLAGEPGTFPGPGTVDDLAAPPYIAVGGIKQTDSTDVMADIQQYGDNNVAAVVQETVDTGTTLANKAEIFQGSATASSSGNVGSIYQHNGTGLNAMLTQDSPLAMSSFWIEQTGAEQQATVEQLGDGAHSGFVSQSGSDQVATVTQLGTGNMAEVTQSGTNNTATVEQNISVGGGGNQAYVDQSGGDSFATIRQSGDGTLLPNTAYIVQASLTGTTATINQSGGGGNSAGIYQN